MNETQCRLPCLPEDEAEPCLGCAFAFWMPEEEPEEQEQGREAA